MTPNEDDIVLICRPVAQLATPVAGSTRDICHGCDTEVWVSKDAWVGAETAAAEQKKALYVYCTTCAPSLPQANDFHMADGQIRTLIANGMKPAEVATLMAVIVATNGSTDVEATMRRALLELDFGAELAQALADAMRQVDLAMRTS